MDKWEYFWTNHDSLSDSAKQMGEEGWELVHYQPCGGYSCFCIWKRKINQDTISKENTPA